MKKKFILVLMLLGLTITSPVFAYQVWYQIPMTFYNVKTGGMILVPHKGPVRPWIIEFADGMISFGEGTTDDFVLQLVDSDGETVYSLFVPAGTSSITLPSTLVGEYDLLLVADTYYYQGYIVL